MNRLRVETTGSKGCFSFDFRLDIECDKITALFGVSGSGKTTLMRVIAGLEHVTNTNVVYRDQVWQDQSVTFKAPHSRGIGLVSQTADLFEHLTVRDNVFYGMRRSEKQNDRSNWMAESDQSMIIETLGIDALFSRAVQHLSGGEKQRVAIARTLFSSPQLLLLDEPVSALDQVSKTSILKCLQKLQRQFHIPIIYISHELDEISLFADKVALLESGSIQVFEDLNAFLANRYAQGVAATYETIWDIPVTQIDVDYSMMSLALGDQSLLVSHRTEVLEDKIRVRVFAKDVSVTLARQSDTSILNILDAQLVRIVDIDDQNLLLTMSLGSNELLAQITKKSFDKLELSLNQSVFVQIKSVALG